MPIDYSKYPKDWRKIRVRILARAENQCECVGECGLHRTTPGPRRCCEVHHASARWAKGRIVLTIAHLDHDTQHNGPEHLKALCQRCHLRYDVGIHARNAAATRERKRAFGTMELLGSVKP